MNQPLDPFSSELSRMLDDAAAAFDPTPDPARMRGLLAGGSGGRRGGVIVLGAAASLALLGGAVWAAQRNGSDGRIAPAVSAERTERTEPPRTSEQPEDPETSLGEPKESPDGTEPHEDGPKDTEPSNTEPKETDPPREEPTTSKPREQPSTTPKPTDPPTTEPHDTEPPETDPPATDPPVGYEWSAHQVYGSCDSDPPFDVFYGTAEPGVKIVIESAYSRKVGYADETGHWEIRVEFSEAPFGEPFQVWVASGEHLDDFWFTRLG